MIKLNEIKIKIKPNNNKTKYKIIINEIKRRLNKNQINKIKVKLK